VVLHSFNGPDGEHPYTALVMGPSGALYGVTADTEGGYGTAFELDPPTDGGTHWPYTVIYQFTDVYGAPSGGLAFGPGGSLYGELGGAGETQGTVYSLTPPSSAGGAWTETNLYNFPEGSGGSRPRGTLAVGNNGRLFGVTENGGRANELCNGGCGTVFSLTPPAFPGGPWTNTPLYAFKPQVGDGQYPLGRVLIGPGGVLYGTTSLGSTKSNNGGNVFSLTPPAVFGELMAETILCSFTQFEDFPESSLALAPNGVLYGTTSSNPGTVFELAPPASPGGSWTETVLHSSTDGGGFAPYGPTLGPDGTLYGTTGGGGAFNHGTVFSLTP
jgi:uncharacterized repeat protein (TIGR03803 family)